MNLDPNVKVSISGIRGSYPDHLTACEMAYLTRAFCITINSKRPIVIGHDNRPEARAIASVLMQVIETEGFQVHYIGLAPLPTTGIVIKEVEAAGGINITASHNSLPDYGLKFLDNYGEFIDQAVLNRLMDTYYEFQDDCTKFLISAKSEMNIDMNHRALQAHLESYPYMESGLKIGIDANNQSGSLILPKLIDRLGGQALLLACDPNKPSVHPFEPTPSNLKWTSDAVKKYSDLDFSVAVDPDADRLVIIKSDGEVLSEEYTLALAVWGMCLQSYPGCIVCNLSTSSLVDAVAKKFNRSVFRAKVGEHNVVSCMKTNSCLMGGEGNGGVIDGSRHYSRDSISALYHLVVLITKTNKSISELVAELPTLIMKKDKLPLAKEINYSQLIDYFQKNAFIDYVDTQDGLRIDFSDGDWFQIRPSNTEPIVRLFGESDNQARLDKLFRTVAVLIGENGI
jgi:phosphomannomutase